MFVSIWNGSLIKCNLTYQSENGDLCKSLPSVFQYSSSHLQGHWKMTSCAEQRQTVDSIKDFTLGILINYLNFTFWKRSDENIKIMFAPIFLSQISNEFSGKNFRIWKLLFYWLAHLRTTSKYDSIKLIMELAGMICLHEV